MDCPTSSHLLRSVGVSAQSGNNMDKRSLDESVRLRGAEWRRSDHPTMKKENIRKDTYGATVRLTDLETGIVVEENGSKSAVVNEIVAEEKLVQRIAEAAEYSEFIISRHNR